MRPENVDNSLQFHVYQGDERLLYVVPTDDGSIFNVHATSAKISVTDRAWRVGATFSGSTTLSACECWGPNPTCFKTGEHVAVNFDRSCDGLTDGDARALKVLDGLPIQRVIWSPKAFIASDSSDVKQTRGTVDPCSGGTGDLGDPCSGD